MRLKPYEYFLQIERPASFVFQKMEQRGIGVDLTYLRELELELTNKRAEVEALLVNDLGSINLNSPKQVLEALHAKEIRPVFKNKSSTDKRALERFRGTPIVDRLLRYSELDTLLCNFVTSYLERGTDVVHPNFNQCGTRTGRPSCSNPNLLQIPRKTDNGKLVRRMFKARPGKTFLDCDYGQIEPRILAHFSKDTNLCNLFRQGVNFHTFTGTERRIDREKAKVLNLSVGYRATFKSVAQQLQCSDHTAQAEIDGWWSLYPELWDWEEKTLYESRRSGFCTTLFGRHIKVDNLTSGNKWQREAAERQLINNIIQGSAAEVMKLGMIKADKAGISMLVQVYDELLVEENENEAEGAAAVLTEALESAVPLDVPLVVDMGSGPTWTDAKP